jgi:hypothetical protein
MAFQDASELMPLEARSRRLTKTIRVCDEQRARAERSCATFGRTLRRHRRRSKRRTFKLVKYSVPC